MLYKIACGEVIANNDDTVAPNIAVSKATSKGACTLLHAGMRDAGGKCPANGGWTGNMNTQQGGRTDVR